MTDRRSLHFTVTRTAEGYAIAASDNGDRARLLRDRLPTAARAWRTLFDLVGGALIAGAAVSYPTEQQVKSLSVAS